MGQWRCFHDRYINTSLFTGEVRYLRVGVAIHKKNELGNVGDDAYGSALLIHLKVCRWAVYIQ